MLKIASFWLPVVTETTPNRIGPTIDDALEAKELKPKNSVESSRFCKYFAIIALPNAGVVPITKPTTHDKM